MDLAMLQSMGPSAAARVAESLATPMSTVRARAATATAPGSSTGADGSQITSSDFLTLLVTEMKNQDPTQPTDPNAYIQQLVGVNSLQQLIAINKDLGSVGGASAAAQTALAPTEAL